MSSVPLTLLLNEAKGCENHSISESYQISVWEFELVMSLNRSSHEPSSYQQDYCCCNKCFWRVFTTNPSTLLSKCYVKWRPKMTMVNYSHTLTPSVFLRLLQIPANDRTGPQRFVLKDSYSYYSVGKKEKSDLKLHQLIWDRSMTLLRHKVNRVTAQWYRSSIWWEIAVTMM